MVGKTRTAIRETLVWWGEFLTKYGKVFAAVIPFIVGGGGWFHLSEMSDKEATIKETRNQVAEVAKQYAKEFKPQIVIHQKASNCGKCIKMINDLRREFHGD